MTRELTNWLLKWQGIGAIVAVIAFAATALLVHGQNLSRLDAAEAALQRLDSGTVTRREFELLLSGINDLRNDVRALRDAIDRRSSER